jgi:dolichyl-phosphate-mannose-protein mannosyltransferase
MMGRVTYLHHYFSALYFSVFMVPFLIDHFLQSTKMKNGVYAIMLGLLVANFIHFSVFSYGMTGDVSQYASREWFKHWDFTSPRLP